MSCLVCNDSGYRTRAGCNSLTFGEDNDLRWVDSRWPCECEAGLRVIGVRAAGRLLDSAWDNQFQIPLDYPRIESTSYGYPIGGAVVQGVRNTYEAA